MLALTQLIDSRCHMGHVRGDAGTQTKALLRRAIQLAHEVPEVQASQAHYHMARGEQSTGLALLQQYTAHHANCPTGWYHYARGCLHSGDRQDAATAILQAHALAPHDPAIHQMACDIFTTTGWLEDARPLIGKMLQGCPNRCSTRVHRQAMDTALRN